MKVTQLPAPPAGSPSPDYPWGELFFKLALAVAAGTFAFRNRVFLERQLRLRAAPLLRAGAKEARSSGAELLAQAGLVERAQAPLPAQPSASALARPESTLRPRVGAPASASPEDGVLKDQLPRASLGGYHPPGGMAGGEAARANSRLHARRGPVGKETGGAEYIVQDMNSPWRGSQEEEVSFWQTQLGIGVKWSAGFSIFFFVLGSLLFRVKKDYVRVSAKRYPGRWR